MSSVKIFTPDDWTGVDPQQHQVKVASKGLGPVDAKAAEKFMSPETAHFFNRMELNPDCFYVHKIAMGCTDRYGPNRWGDGFSEKALKNDVYTFEKNAKAYRQHKSKDDYYGHVKLARFRDADGIVELITEYYGTPKVAAAKGGEVADKEIEMLMKRGYIPVSMGSLVPYDVCSTCDHKAPKPKDRCKSKEEGGSCNMFGCSSGMLKVAANGMLQYVDNPYNNFYDISMVKVGADPIANGVLLPVGDYYANLSENSKIAEFASTQLPEFIDDTPESRSLTQLLNKAAAMEFAYSRMDADDASAGDLGYCKLASASDEFSRQLLGTLSQQQTAIGGVASKNSFISFKSLAKVAGLSESQAEAAATQLPDLYSRVIAAGLTGPVVNTAAKLAAVCRGYRTKFLINKTAGLSLSEITRQSLVAAARGEQVKQLSVAHTDSVLSDVTLKYASLELCLSHLADDADFRLRALVRRKLYLL